MDLKDYPLHPILPGSKSIEIINPDIQRGEIRFALFDFDGTISLIREGWQDVMIPMMVDILTELNSGETQEELTLVVKEFITRLTGKQTIYQMMELVENIEQRGGTPKTAKDYKWDYLNLLWEEIADRVAGLKESRFTREEMAVPGSLEFVKTLAPKVQAMYVASGTDQPYVLDESACLGLPEYFEDRIFGALEDFESFSKAILMKQIITENNLHGPEFVAFGDGYVEIENAKEVGGIAVGVATEEAKREGVDEWKRNRLIDAGADIIVPDFRETDLLIKYLFNEI